MNISKLGQSQAGAASQPVNFSKATVKASNAGSAGSTDSTAAAPESAKQRRIADFAQRVDKRLEGAMNQTGLSDRQIDALKQLQDKFQGQIKRATNAAEGGELHGALQNIMSALQTGVQGILGTADVKSTKDLGATDATAKPVSLRGSARNAGGTENQIDTIA